MTETAPRVTSDHCDTLRVTLPAHNFYATALLEVHTLERARDGYTRAVRTDDGLVWMVNPDRPDMGCSVILDGECCRSLRSEGRFFTIVRQLAEIEGARCSRIDLAFDVDSRSVLDLAHAAVRAGAFVSPANRNSWRTVEGGDGGLTVYLGSRQSERFLRIYDKAAQQKTGGEWTRFELEVKGERADPTFRSWLEGVQSRQIVSDFIRFVEEEEGPYNKHNDRRKVCAWWAALCESAVKVNVYREKIKSGVVKKFLWFEKYMLSLARQYAEHQPELLENLQQCNRPLSSVVSAPAL